MGLCRRGGDLGLSESGSFNMPVKAERGRRGGSQKDRDDALRMKHGHHIGPDGAARVSPQDPRYGVQFGMSRLDRHLFKGLEEGFVGAKARVHPEFGGSRGGVRFFTQHVVKRAQQRAVPLLGQRLPVQVVSGCFSFLARLRAGTVLVDDHAAQARGSAADPEVVSDAQLQFVRGGRGWIFNLHIAPGPLMRSCW